jgi:hypothetical protein
LLVKLANNTIHVRVPNYLIFRYGIF